MPDTLPRPDSATSRRPSLVFRALLLNGAVVVLTALLFALLLSLVLPPAGLNAPGARMAYWARQVLWPALVLFAMVLGVMAMRGRTAALNPIDDPESRTQRVCQRVLANSVEQTAIFVPALAALVATLPVPSLGVAAVATWLFVLGRLLFWAGYLIHPFARAPGMAMTLTVNLIVLGWAVLLQVGGMQPGG
ncbi:MAPEG family protein [Azospirillum picis]|uniref:MAPEG superfamily protein n=1 Tax=Azospirillum picis TaxID=488438 RepID=A0ABU0MPX2_9PROT|nr:MAPEG family protein [Azospirillum picis]MBP2301715.1 putative MAPEG superfamily protein [Azospirillum picis]MDQ0535461.1 putative MAPEG superfamily protein [Azospirillum picis]